MKLAAVFVVLLVFISYSCHAQEQNIIEADQTSDPTDPNATPDQESCNQEVEDEGEKQAAVVRFVIVLGTACLALTFLWGYFLEKFHIFWFPEAGCGIVIGIATGAIVKAARSSDFKDLTKFDPEFFFIFLLPPIIFEAGYNMKRQAFFRNIGAICVFAFLGTTISTFLVGGIVYGIGQLGWCHPLGGLASLVFGALISATDPVTVLAVFQKVRADIDLYSLVFGESVLNDAVAIVLYRALIIFKCEPISAGSIFNAFGSFLIIFGGSFIVGIAFALLSALIFKNCAMHLDSEFLFLELTMLCTFPYMAFMMAEGLRFSGIVAILFCGIGMAHYTYNNLSKEAKSTSRSLFKTLATLAETFVFVYLGLAMFSFEQTWSQVKLIIVALVACLIARVFNVYPCSLLANLGRKPTGKPGRINQKFQFVMWFSGLRGAVAFVIAVTSYSNNDFGPDSASILTTTLFIAVITVFSMGGLIGTLLSALDVKEKNTDEVQSAYPEGGGGLMVRDQSKPMKAKGLIYWDRKYMKPIFTRYEFKEPNPNEPHNPAAVDDDAVTTEIPLQ
eukprot:TRINITY_DN51970_c0_g2_i1.p1 TRINITY_DN51970_c0_g2~~TRINITY_DN51970_c0_g2_i1.p1  ORF type:complete len:560 (-),score=65.60 TRINITY_DN51970_c0_g2_i1:1061-2740(-)